MVLIARRLNSFCEIKQFSKRQRVYEFILEVAFDSSTSMLECPSRVGEGEPIREVKGEGSDIFWSHFLSTLASIFQFFIR